jgi:branched-chain amino acid transport system substrate-binding protein
MQLAFAYFRLKPLSRLIAIAAATVFLIVSLSLCMSRLPNADKAIAIAVAAPLTGTAARSGQEMVEGIQLYIDKVNRQGGVHGHPIKLLIFDDKSSVNGAKEIAKDIVQSSVLMVIGHHTSDSAIAAGTIYHDNKLSAITGTATNEKVTAGRPYYFRTTYTNATLASVLSIYAQQVLQFKTASIIYDKGSKNEQETSARIKSAFEANGTVKRIWALDFEPKNRKESIQQMLKELAAESDPGILFLTFTKEDVAEDFLVALRQSGLKTPVLGEQVLAQESFAHRFEKYDAEKKDLGFFTDGMYVASPLLFDSAGANAQEFVSTYQKTYSKMPSTLSGKFYEATLVAVEALRKSDLQITDASLSKDRELVRTALNSLNNTQEAVSGLTGSIYFNANRDSNPPVRVGQFQDRKLLSASQQFTAIANPQALNIAAELQAGSIVRVGDQLFKRQRVVYTGLDLNKLNRIDKSSFTADFYLWFRFNGNNDPVQIQFPDAISNSVNPNAPIFDPDRPLKSQIVDNGLNYRLYRVRGEFRSAFNYRDYPFDSQNLTLRFDNPNLSSDRVVYAIDSLGLKLPKPIDAQQKAFQTLQLWDFKDMAYFQDTSRSDSTQGNPNLFESKNTQIDYPGFSLRITLKRKSLTFLTKNLLPLLILTLIAYCALFFPYNMFVPRTIPPASALLSGIVLLSSTNNQLPEVGYTVAIEYFFYTFFGLCLIPIIVTAIGAKLEKEGYQRAFKYLNFSSKIIFPIILFFLFVFCIINYSRS